MQQFIPLHQHLLVKAFITTPIDSEFRSKAFLRHIVREIGMKAVTNPQAAYVAELGNEGFTGSINLATSHIAFHCWDVTKLLMLDVYSCQVFKVGDVVKLIELYFGETTDIHLVLFDRSTMKIMQEFRG